LFSIIAEPRKSAAKIRVLLRNKHRMALKSDIYHKDYLLWISPVIILVLLFFAIRRDNRERDSAILNNGNFRADSSLTILTPARESDLGKMSRYIDSPLIFYATAKGN